MNTSSNVSIYGNHLQYHAYCTLAPLSAAIEAVINRGLVGGCRHDQGL